MRHRRPLITLFTDAGVRHHKPPVGAWAFWAKKSPIETMRGGDVIKAAFSYVHQAELIACANALTCLHKAGWLQVPHHILWQTDSLAAIGTWKKFFAQQRTLPDFDATVAKTMYTILQDTSSSLGMRHVKAHRGTVDPRAAVNTYCDELCTSLLRGQA